MHFDNYRLTVNDGVAHKKYAGWSKTSELRWLRKYLNGVRCAWENKTGKMALQVEGDRSLLL